MLLPQRWRSSRAEGTLTSIRYYTKGGSPAPPSARNGGVRVEGPALVLARKSAASPANRDR